ncbi:MAG: hypothetical protein IKA10_04560 [Oscillospiraceae bacterium]|nr:hypothetical protein [Oscillospiraceae bacterium]
MTLRVYAENRIKSETKTVLFWMGRAAKDLRDGNAKMAHLCLTTALHHALDIAMAQEEIYIRDLCQNEETKLDYEEIYKNALAQANKEMAEEDEGEIK